MKAKQLLIIISALGILASCSNENKIKCHLTGDIVDRTDGNLFLYSPESSRFDKDTIPFKDSHFNYKITLKSPEVYWLFFEEDLKNGEGFTSVNIFLEPGNVHLTLSADSILNCQVKGGTLNKKLYDIEKKLQLINNNLIIYYDKISTTDDSLIINDLNIKIDSLENLYFKTQTDYISNNEDLISAFYIWELRKQLDKDKVVKLLNPLKEKFAYSRYIRETDAFIQGFGKNQPNQQFTDYKLLNEKGGEISISEIVHMNKATLILFWSSRCEASDRKLKAMKPLYDQYKDLGFEIIGISGDYNLNRWKEAIN